MAKGQYKLSSTVEAALNLDIGQAAKDIEKVKKLASSVSLGQSDDAALKRSIREIEDAYKNIGNIQKNGFKGSTKELDGLSESIKNIQNGAKGIAEQMGKLGNGNDVKVLTKEFQELDKQYDKLLKQIKASEGVWNKIGASISDVQKTGGGNAVFKGVVDGLEDVKKGGADGVKALSNVKEELKNIAKNDFQIVDIDKAEADLKAYQRKLRDIDKDNERIQKGIAKHQAVLAVDPENKSAQRYLNDWLKKLDILEKKKKEVAAEPLLGDEATRESISQLIKLQREFDKLEEEIKQAQSGDNFTSTSKLTSELNETKNKMEQLTNEIIEDSKKINNAYEETAAEAKNMGVSLDKAWAEARVGEDVFDTLTSSMQRFFSADKMWDVFVGSVRKAIDVVKELDKEMVEIAVVTDYSLDEVWAKRANYIDQATRLGAKTNDYVRASALYYQQGLGEKEVQQATEETIKMARIAGLEGAKATDLMTAAVRGFDMSMKDANRVNDVYSKLAAVTAADTGEIAEAMTKTASIAHNAGAEFENIAAMMGLAIETTREAPENIGTAMKTIIARFQEMKKSPDEIGLIDGEIVDPNKITTALRTVGIEALNMNGEFRDFDDIMYEISKKWDSMTKMQQRYIATTAAGSRQQSRFIAMVSNYQHLQNLTDQAWNAQGAGTEQFNKTLDSMEAKVNKVQNQMDLLATSLFPTDMFKPALDGFSAILQLVNTITGKLPSIVNLFLGGGLGLAMMKGGGFLTKIFAQSMTAFKDSNFETSLAMNVFSGINEGFRKFSNKKSPGAELAAPLAAQYSSIFQMISVKAKTTWASVQAGGIGAFGAILGKVALITAAIGGFIYLLKYIFKYAHDSSFEGRFEKVAKQTRLAEEAQQSLNTEYDELISKQSELAKQETVFATLTQGTQEWYQAILDVNSTITDLMSKYGELRDHVTFDEFGKMEIAEEGWKSIIDGLKEKQENNAIYRKSLLASQKAIEVDQLKAQERATKGLQSNIRGQANDYTIPQAYAPGQQVYNEKVANEAKEKFRQQADAYDNDIKEISTEAKVRMLEYGNIWAQQYSQMAAEMIADAPSELDKQFSRAIAANKSNDQEADKTAMQAAIKEVSDNFSSIAELQSEFTKKTGISIEQLADEDKQNRNFLATEIASVDFTKGTLEQFKSLHEKMRNGVNTIDKAQRKNVEDLAGLVMRLGTDTASAFDHQLLKNRFDGNFSQMVKQLADKLGMYPAEIAEIIGTETMERTTEAWEEESKKVRAARDEYMTRLSGIMGSNNVNDALMDELDKTSSDFKQRFAQMMTQIRISSESEDFDAVTDNMTEFFKKVGDPELVEDAFAIMQDFNIDTDHGLDVLRTTLQDMGIALDWGDDQFRNFVEGIQAGARVIAGATVDMEKVNKGRAIIDKIDNTDTQFATFTPEEYREISEWLSSSNDPKDQDLLGDFYVDQDGNWKYLGDSLYDLRVAVDKNTRATELNTLKENIKKANEAEQFLQGNTSSGINIKQGLVALAGKNSSEIMGSNKDKQLLADIMRGATKKDLDMMGINEKTATAIMSKAYGNLPGQINAEVLDGVLGQITPYLSNIESYNKADAEYSKQMASMFTPNELAKELQKNTKSGDLSETNKETVTNQLGTLAASMEGNEKTFQGANFMHYLTNKSKTDFEGFMKAAQSEDLQKVFQQIEETGIHFGQIMDDLVNKTELKARLAAEWENNKEKVITSESGKIGVRKDGGVNTATVNKDELQKLIDFFEKATKFEFGEGWQMDDIMNDAAKMQVVLDLLSGDMDKTKSAILGMGLDTETMMSVLTKNFGMTEEKARELLDEMGKFNEMEFEEKTIHIETNTVTAKEGLGYLQEYVNELKGKEIEITVPKDATQAEIDELEKYAAENDIKLSVVQDGVDNTAKVRSEAQKTKEDIERDKVQAHILADKTDFDKKAEDVKATKAFIGKSVTTDLTLKVGVSGVGAASAAIDGLLSKSSTLKSYNFRNSLFGSPLAGFRGSAVETSDFNGYATSISAVSSYDGFTNMAQPITMASTTPGYGGITAQPVMNAMDAGGFATSINDGNATTFTSYAGRINYDDRFGGGYSLTPKKPSKPMPAKTAKPAKPSKQAKKDSKNIGKTAKATSDNAKATKDNQKKKEAQDKKWENTYDRLYNLVKLTEKEIRYGNNLQKDREALLEDGLTQTAIIADNINKQRQSLNAQMNYWKRQESGRRQDLSLLYAEFKDVKKYAYMENDTVKIDWSAIEKVTNQDTGERISKYISGLEKIQGEIEKSQDGQRDIKKEIVALQKLGRDDYMKLEERVHAAIVQSAEDQIEKTEGLIQATKDTNEALLSGIKDGLSKARDARKENKDLEDLREMENKLATLRRDPRANAKEIRDLEERLADSRESLADARVDKMIDRLDEGNQAAVDQRIQQLEVMKLQHEAKLLDGTYWNQAYSFMQKLIDKPNDIQLLINHLKKAEEVDNMSNMQRQDWIQELRSTIESGLAWYISSSGKYKPKNTTSSGNKSTNSSAKSSSSAKSIEKVIQASARVKASSTAKIYDRKGATVGKAQYFKNDPLYTVLEVIGEWVKVRWHKHNKGVAGWMKKGDLKAYKEGGLVDYTGLAWVDGKKGKPESFLNAEDTQNFMELKGVLSNLKLDSYNGSQSNGSIENTFYISVDKLANNYDTDDMMKRIQKNIKESANHRNVNTITRRR